MFHAALFRNEKGTKILWRQADWWHAGDGDKMSEPKTGIESSQNEPSCDEVIALCGGDPGVAVRALLVAYAFLEGELLLTKLAVSFGCSKGWHTGRDHSGKRQVLKPHWRRWLGVENRCSYSLTLGELGKAFGR
jgi:hypothetical protein